MFLTFISILLYLKNITGYLHVTMIEQLLKSKNKRIHYNSFKIFSSTKQNMVRLKNIGTLLLYRNVLVR